MTAATDAPDAPDTPAPSDTLDDVERVLRPPHAALPEGLGLARLPEARTIGTVRWLETQVSARQRRLDRSRGLCTRRWKVR
jgi:hypothetical protein